MPQPPLVIQQVCKNFGPVEVLRSVSLTASAGEFITLLGPSGCGKTTLLRIIAGLETADRGTVRLGDLDLLPLPAYKRPVNTVFQHYALFPHLNVYENIAFGLRSRKFAKGEIARRVEQGLAMLRLEELARREPHQLSGGQRQRVALARALVNEPDVLLLDEPMSALDAQLRADVQLELRTLQRRLGKTFILVTHDQDEAMTVSDRILVMRAGVIEQAGSPNDVYDRPVNRFVAEFLGSANLLQYEMADGHAQTAAGPLRLLAAPPAARGTLAIRPERIRVVESNGLPNTVAARVRDCIFRGDHADLFAATQPAAGESQELRVRMTAANGHTPDSIVYLELPPEHLVELQP